MAYDPQVNLFRAALVRQEGGGGEIQVFRGAHRYQYGQGFGDVLRNVWKVVAPVILHGGKSLFKAGAKALKDGSSTSDALRSSFKPALRSIFKHGGRALGDALAPQQPSEAELLAEVPLLHQDTSDVGAVPTVSQPAVSQPSAVPLKVDPTAEKPKTQAGSGYKAKRKRRSSAKKSKSKSNFKSKSKRSKYNF